MARDPEAKECSVKRKLFVLSGILGLSLLANSAQAVVPLCTSYWGKSCPINGAEATCRDSQGFTWDCVCTNNKWYCTS